MRNVVCQRGLYLMVLALFLFIDRAVALQQDSTFEGRQVKLAYTNAPLKTVLKSIEKQTGLHFLGSRSQSVRISIPESRITVTAFLRQYLSPKGYTWRWKGEQSIILYPPPSNWVAPPDSEPLQTAPVTIMVTGTVTDEALLPLPGVSIQVRGEKKGTNTDTAGRFQLQVNRADAVMEIRLMGYETQRVPIAGSQMFKVQLKASDKDLDEVVVVAYTSDVKRNLAGAVTAVSLLPTRQVGSSNVLGALQGIVPGLQIDQTSGMPGSAFVMQLRGRNSLANIAGPLLVINGIPYVGSFPIVNLRPSISSQNVNGGISSFNLQMFGEIESITVLKDAEATSIYGSRGANGVILIKTVRGKPGKLSLDATLVYGRGKISRKLQLYGRQAYLNMREEAFRNDGLTPGNEPGAINFAPDLTVWDRFHYTDWQKELLGKTAIITDATVALSFGNKYNQVRIGGNYYKETSVLTGDQSYSRTNVNFAADHTNKDSSLQISMYGLFSFDQHYSFNGSTRAVFTPANATANWGGNNSLSWQPGINHPYADFLKLYSLAKRNYLMSAVVQWQPIKGFVMRTNLGLSGLNTNETDQLPIASQNPLLSVNPTGSATIAGKDIIGYIVEPVIEYRLPFLHELTAVAGASFQHTSTTNRIITGEGYTSDADLLKLDKAAYLSTNFKNTTAYQYAAFLGRLKYQLLDKYIVNASFRRDASSRFGPDKNSGSFWSVAAAWIFSEESFAVNLWWLHFGKLRGSMGLTGSDLVEDNQYRAVWATNPANNPYQGVQGLSPQAPYNPDFSWERCLKKEVALDLTFWKGRLQTSFSYFRNKSYNQLVETELPAQLGFDNMLRNRNAVILNTGLEITVSAHLIQSPGMQLSLAANLTLPRNKLVAFDNLKGSRYHGTLLLNEPVTVLNKLVSDRVDKMDGLYKMKDLDGKPGYTVDDYANIGSLDPKLMAGFQVNFSWKNLSVGMVVDIRKQMGMSYLYPMMLADMYPGGLSNQITDVDYRWRQPGDEGKKYQRLSSLPAGEVNGTKSLIINSNLSYDNTSYAKLRELSLAYSLPASILKRMHCQHAIVFLTGRNLLTISGYPGGDPEIANPLSLSTLRVLSFGIKLSL